MESDMKGKWKLWVPAVFAVGLALGVSAPAASFPLTRGAIAKTPGNEMIVSVAQRKRARHNGSGASPRAHHAVPGPDPDCPWLKSWNPANPDRGFCDPGFAHHGNINGCVVDQGYGRWISCDSMMR
jgi:hypothetical protein